jgi:predicted DNA-binding protein
MAEHKESFEKVLVPKEVKAKFSEVAKKNSVTKSSILLKAIHNYINENKKSH